MNGPAVGPGLKGEGGRYPSRVVLLLPTSAVAVGIAALLLGWGRPAPTTGGEGTPTSAATSRPSSTRPRLLPEAFHERSAERLRMVADLLRYHHPRVTDARVIRAMRRVPRHCFVPDRYQDAAYDDTPLPIGCGQTISQPYIVALMSQLLKVEPGMRVLEVGTGSGYQAAVLAEMGCEVYTIEIFEELGRQAEKRLKQLGYDRVRVRVGDGYFGWKEHAPYDAIVVTCAATHLPPALLEQLKPGGRICIPLGAPYSVQDLVVVEKRPDGSLRSRSVIPVRFVPLRGGHESQSGK